MTLEGRTLSIEQLDAIEVLRNLLPELRQIIERLEKKRRQAPQTYSGRIEKKVEEKFITEIYTYGTLEKSVEKSPIEVYRGNLEVPLN